LDATQNERVESKANSNRDRSKFSITTKNTIFHEHLLEEQMMVVSLVHYKEVEANPHDFNSSFHKREEAPEQDLLFDVDLNLTYFGRWMHPILCSQCVSLNDIAVFTLPKFFVNELLEISSGALIQGHISRSHEEELLELLTTPWPERNEKGWFCRLDPVSLKDGVDADKPLRSKLEFIRVLASSYRGTSALRRFQEMGREIKVYLLPWNDTMDVDREFRVFVAPKSRGVSAISQYGWSRPFPLKDGEKHHTVAFVVSLEAVRLYTGIYHFAGEALLEQGFTFDIRLTENVANVLGEGYKGNPCQLIELNTFGLLSGCGSALFHWIKDYNLLYRSEQLHPIEVRFSYK
jgi:hypothetical protein